MIRLDGRDLKMLAILQREGRIAKATLAERIALSATPCGERLKRLEDAGLITGYGAFVAPNAFGPVQQVFTQIELAQHRTESFARFEETVVPLDEVTAVWALGGGFDYLVQFSVPNIDAYQRIIDTLLEIDIGIVRYFTFVVTKEIVRKPWPRVPSSLEPPSSGTTAFGA